MCIFGSFQLTATLTNEMFEKEIERCVDIYDICNVIFQPVIKCSKLTIETLAKGVEYVQS